MNKLFFIDVILPLPLKQLYTYEVTEEEYLFLKKGVRVSVPFGKTKIYTGLVYDKHNNPPQKYQAKSIQHILDESPIVHPLQLKFWKWISEYYYASIGEVMRAALPSNFLLESETFVYLEDNIEWDLMNLTDEEFLIIEAFKVQSLLSVKEIQSILSSKQVFPVLHKMVASGMIVLKDEMISKYKPKLVKYVSLASRWRGDGLKELMESLKNAKKQREAVLCYFKLTANKDRIQWNIIKKEANISTSIINALVEKDVFQWEEYKEDRVQFNEETSRLLKLNEFQSLALKNIKRNFLRKKNVLLHGVTK